MLTLSVSSIVTYLSLISITSADSDKSKSLAPCNIISPRTGAQFDLSPLAVVLPTDGNNKKGARNESWHARGYDYGANFTMNFCAPVVENLTSVVGVEKEQWANISAFYTKMDETYSIGQLSTEPIFRGRKLVMNFTDGSPCGEDLDKWALDSPDSQSLPLSSRSSREDDDDEDEDPPKKKPSKDVRRKNTIISFLCDQEPIDSSRPKVAVSFVSWSQDECTYVFEARSHYSCGGLAKQPESVGPGGVFSIIAVITIAVYILGGIAYQRTVMHQRGWRQLPNYSMWAGIASFMRDIGIILFSSCSRIMPRRRGYNQLPTQSTRGRGISREEENGLIDQLDEEWDD